MFFCGFWGFGVSLEVQDQTKWLVFRRIHVKDSLKFGLWTSGFGGLGCFN